MTASGLLYSTMEASIPYKESTLITAYVLWLFFLHSNDWFISRLQKDIV